MFFCNCIQFISFHIISHDFIVISCHFMSCGHVISCHVVMSFHVMWSCHIISIHFISCLFISYHFYSLMHVHWAAKARRLARGQLRQDFYTANSDFKIPIGLGHFCRKTARQPPELTASCWVKMQIYRRGWKWKWFSKLVNDPKV